MTTLLPVGTIVTVTERGPIFRPPYRAIVRGYDLGHTKYELGVEYVIDRFLDGGSWAFPSEVEPTTSSTNQNQEPQP